MPVGSTSFAANGSNPGAAQKTATSMFPRWRQTSSNEAYQAEVNLFKLCRSNLEIVNTPVGKGSENFMHSIQGGSKDAPPLVCMPGYGAGAGFYFRNLDHLCKHFRTYAVDWLGTGMSGRPDFKASDRVEAENFFLESLETWRERSGLDKFILMGHSLGGYLAANYALRHPERVEHLILVCPAAIAGKLGESETPSWAESPWGWRGALWRTAKGLWNVGVTPQMVIRGVGPWGPKFINGYVMQRFKQGLGLDMEESEAMRDYFYHITASKGSGEFALRHILAPFAWARAPLEKKLGDLKVPITFIYGEQDWMDPMGAQNACRNIEKTRGRLQVPSDQRISIIPDAGHFVFLDQPELFQKEVVETCKTYIEDKAKAAKDPEE